MIKNDFFFIWFSEKEYEMPLLHYLSLKSCLKVNNPDSITLFCNNTPFGKYWEELEDFVNIAYMEPDFNMDLRENSAIKRFDVLYQNGGIYSDLDILYKNSVVRFLDKGDIVLCKRGKDSSRYISSCFIMSKNEHGLLYIFKNIVFENIKRKFIRASVLYTKDVLNSGFSPFLLSSHALFKNSLKDLLSPSKIEDSKVLGFHLYEGDIKQNLEKYLDIQCYFAEFANDILAYSL